MHYLLESMRKWYKFSGRARREEFWLNVLFTWILLPVFFLLVGFVSESGFIDTKSHVFTIFLFPLIICSLGLIFANFSCSIRRLHDVNMSGTWILLHFIPPLNFVILIFALIPGQEGPNRFGEDPKQQDLTLQAD